MQSLDSIKNEVVKRLEDRINNNPAELVLANNRQAKMQSLVTEILSDVVGADNVRAYGIHWREGEFFLYAANSDES